MSKTESKSYGTPQMRKRLNSLNKDELIDVIDKYNIDMVGWYEKSDLEEIYVDILKFGSKTNGYAKLTKKGLINYALGQLFETEEDLDPYIK